MSTVVIHRSDITGEVAQWDKGEGYSVRDSFTGRALRWYSTEEEARMAVAMRQRSKMRRLEYVMDFYIEIGYDRDAAIDLAVRHDELGQKIIPEPCQEAAMKALKAYYMAFRV